MLRDLFGALRDPGTWMPWRNGWALFGLLWGLPIPVLSIGVHRLFAGDWGAVADAWLLHLLSLAHPVLFLAVFGAVGTIQRRRQEELQSALARVAAAAETDALTGLANRRALFHRLEQEIERAARESDTLSCIMVDLNRFKPINDRYGHAVGDDLLVLIARRLGAVAREYDVIGRYGGDEFVFILPHTGREAARAFGERLKGGLSDSPFAVNGIPSPLTMTASVGIATWPDDARTASGLLDAADQAMYAAKGTRTLKRH